MGDRKALQAGTSHNLGTNFAKVWTWVVWGWFLPHFRPRHGSKVSKVTKRVWGDGGNGSESLFAAFETKKISF